MRRTLLITALLAGLPACQLAAWQCPDGAPPPCRGAAPARRLAPPLDDRTWIVVPFSNVANAADIDWLKNASVNLLYLDMSKWRDIRVIDDERVADLMREVPEIRAGQALTLQTGMAVARRAGAGKLVMGDLLKVGNRTQVVAKVFDVRSGQRLRSVRGETSNADSLMGIFGALARGILNAEPPAGTSLGTVGTTSLDAYRFYVAGIGALNRVDLDSADYYFTRAVAADSTFALAHYKLSVVLGWQNPGDPHRVQHAETANRLSTGLPARERALILGQQQNSANRWGDACATYNGVLRTDSSDVEAWYNLGECNYHDAYIAFAGGDSTKPAFRGSWNLALRAFLRALDLDPTYHLAYSHLPDILLVDSRTGCAGRDLVDRNCPAAQQYLASTLRDADSLLQPPISGFNPAGMAAQARAALAQGVWRSNVQRNRDYAQAWVNAGPGERRAHAALAQALLRQGLPVEAAREFALARSPLRAGDLSRGLISRLELLIKLDSTAAAGQLADSLLTVRDTAGIGPNLAFTAMLLGRHGRVELIFTANPLPPPVMRFFKAALLTMQGAVPADLVAAELGLDSFIAQQAPEPQRAAARSNLLMLTAPWTMSLDRPPALQALDTAAADPRVQVMVHAVRRDTAALRRALASLDSVALATPREVQTAVNFQIAAEGYLLLGDSATAYARLREFDARFLFLSPLAPYSAGFGNLTASIQTWGRTWLRLADLAAARGDRDVAVHNYRRVIGLWQGADPPFQPMVQRARAALARLGG
jgi:tetratricopeptide (TPR) repeat protein/TolB-like protein